MDISSPFTAMLDCVPDTISQNISSPAGTRASKNETNVNGCIRGENVNYIQGLARDGAYRLTPQARGKARANVEETAGRYMVQRERVLAAARRRYGYILRFLEKLLPGLRGEDGILHYIQAKASDEDYMVPRERPTEPTIYVCKVNNPTADQCFRGF